MGWADNMYYFYQEHAIELYQDETYLCDLKISWYYKRTHYAYYVSYFAFLSGERRDHHIPINYTAICGERDFSQNRYLDDVDRNNGKTYAEMSLFPRQAVDSPTGYEYPDLAGNHTFRFYLSIDNNEDITDKDGNKVVIDEVIPMNFMEYSYGTTLLTAPNFSDEENPTITFSIGNANPSYDRSTMVSDTLAIISFNGETDDIVRSLGVTPQGSSYTFELTEEEKQRMRLAVTEGINKQFTFRLKTLPLSTNKQKPHISELQKTFTLVGAYPTATLTIEDIDPKTLALTGDKNVIVKYHSDAAYEINSTASKGATIVSEQVTCGNKTSTTETGVLENVESNIFTFGAVDNRNNGVAGTLTKGFVDYIKLTCQQKINFDLTGADSTGAAATVTIEGNYWRGNFGLTDNTLVVQIRHTQNDGKMGDWVTLTDFVEVYYGDGSYSLDFGISGLNYTDPYTFQCRAVDKLNTIETAQYTTRVMPVFDWSGEDFNFNVPVNINENPLNIKSSVLNMNDNTVLRYNENSKNTVISANGGHIYLRPSGTNETSCETIFYSNGNISFGGSINIGDTFTIGDQPLNDFVIASGTEAMGSNGTWYWRKWASGKAECWGCRNFGNMAISTAYGSLYRSAIFNQNLPSDLFSTTPDVINIQFINGGNGCLIAKWNDVAPSAVVSGSFVVINAVSGNVTPTNIGFYVAGLSK